jgi:iron-sulfur cluster assembly protein
MSDCGDVKKVFVKNNQEEAAKLKPISGIDITDSAAEKIKHFAAVDKKSSEEYGLRVSVVKDGCSGNSYTMNLANIAESKENGDKIFTKNGATVIIEKLSYMFVLGSQLDYQESLLASGFQLVNPNIKKSCSCGSSFSV